MRIQTGLCVIALLGLGLLPTSPVRAFDSNGFLAEAGRADVALSVTAEAYDHFWVGTQEVSDAGLGEVETRSLALWGRYGFTDRLSLFVNLPYVETEATGPAPFEESDLQDLAVLLAARILEVSSGGTTHSLVIGGGVRTPASDYEDNLPTDVGDGTTDGLLRLIYQLRRGSFYFSQQLGFDLRSGDAPDGFPLLTEVGVGLGVTTLSLHYALYRSDGGTDIGDPGFTFPGLKEEYDRLGARVFVKLNPTFGLSAGGWTTLDGRNTGKTTGISLSTVLSF